MFYENIIDKDHNRYYSGDVSTLDLETLLEKIRSATDEKEQKKLNNRLNKIFKNLNK
jgi:hypothetical protein